MKKLFIFLNIFSLILGALPSPAFAQSISTPSATESLISSLSPSATDSADQSSPLPSFSDPQQLSANLKITPPVFALALTKSNFQAKEQVEVVVKNSVSKNLSISVEDESDKNYTPHTAQTSVNGDTIFTIYPSANLKPGRYKVKVVDTSSNQVISEQEFTWGVLAINTNKSIYAPGETAKIAMAVLNEGGNMVCNAKVTLDIASPYGLNTHLSTDDGSIKVNPDCKIRAYTLNPDYEATYQTSDVGRYTTTLTATTSNGSYTTKDRFEVRSYVPFDIERDTATRIYPPDKYPVKMKIHANEAFIGNIVESVPSDFQISQLQQEGAIGYAQENAVPDSLGADKNYGIPHLNLPFNGNYPVTLGFGQEIDNPKDKDVYKKSGLDGHDGIDFALPERTPILAVDSGKVILAQENWIYGTSIVIQHNWGRTYYGHLSKLEVSVGENVSSGTEIGLSGSTGLATGPHLHFGLKPNDNDIDNLYFGKIDPAPYLGISSEDPVLSVSNYPISTKALVWNVDIEKGADFTIAYQYKAPNKSPNFYTIGPLQFISSEVKAEKPAKFDVNINPFVLGVATTSGVLISTSSADLTSTGSANLAPQSENIQPSGKDKVVFQEIRPWQIAVDAGIAFRSAWGSNNAGGGTTITMTVPAGVVDGDVMVMAIILRSQASPTVPTGWSLLTANTLTTPIRQELLWRVASSEPASYVVTLNASVKASGEIIVLLGADHTVPAIGQTIGTTTVASTIVTANALGATWSSSNGIDVGMFGGEAGTTYTPPTNYTEPTNGEAAATGGNAATRTSIEVAYRALTAVTTVGSIAATAATSEDNIGQHVFIKEAASGAATPTLDQLMRHGKWFNAGVEQPFTF